MDLDVTSWTPEQLQELLDGPAQKPPVGVVPNFKNSSTLAEYLILTLVLSLIIATLSLLFRIYTKAFILRSINFEDYVNTLAWLSWIALIVPAALISLHGCLAHTWNLRLKTFFKMLHVLFNISNIIYSLLIIFVKTSILLQYLRIFVPKQTHNMPLYIAIHVCIWSCFICYIVGMAFSIAMCSPRQKIWNPLLPGHCFNNAALFLATGIFNGVSDFAILILPMPTLWRLQIPLRKRLLVGAVFGCGFLACVTCIPRIYYACKIYKNEDLSYNLAIFGLWTHAEIGVGITVCNLPVLPRFFQHFGPRIRSSILFRYKFGFKSTSSFSEGRATGDRSNTKAAKPSMVRSESASHCGIKARIASGYITISDFESPSAANTIPSKTLMEDATESRLSGIATRRGDVELGVRQNYN